MSDNDKAVHDLGVGMTLILELFAPIREATTGYRNQMIAAGFDPVTADMMAADFHHASIEMIMAQAMKGMK